MNNFLEIFVTAVGIIMSFSYCPQLYRIYTRKSSEDISLSTYTFLSGGGAVWMFYGLYIKNWVIFWGYIFGVILTFAILILSFKYRKIVKI